MNKEEKEAIKTMYKQVKDKKLFIETLAPIVSNKESSLAANWFSRLWSIPDEHQNTVLQLLNETIENQKQPA
jgi:hypothetical protein